MGEDVDIFAYPFGRWSDAAVGYVKQAGYRFAFTSDSGFLDDSINQFTLKRTNVGMRSAIMAQAYAAGCSERLTADIRILRDLFSVIKKYL